MSNSRSKPTVERKSGEKSNLMVTTSLEAMWFGASPLPGPRPFFCRDAAKAIQAPSESRKRSWHFKELKCRVLINWQDNESWLLEPRNNAVLPPVVRVLGSKGDRQ